MYMHVKVLIKRDVTTTMLSFKIQRNFKQGNMSLK